MTDLSNVHDRIQTIFAEKLHIDPPAVEFDLIESGVLDSLSLVTLLVHLEEDFGVKIMLENLDIDDFSSIGKIARFLSVANGHTID